MKTKQMLELVVVLTEVELEDDLLLGDILLDLEPRRNST